MLTDSRREDEYWAFTVFSLKGSITMRQVTKWIIRAIFLVLSLDAIVLFVEWFGAWEGLEHLLAAHPILERYTLKGPFFPLICLGLCFIVVFADRYLKRPDIHAEYVCLELIPRTGLLPIQMLDEAFKIGGRNSYEINVDVMIEVYLVNQSEHEVTIREFSGEMLLQYPRLSRFPRISAYFPKRRIKLLLAKDFPAYRIKKEQIDAHGNSQTKYAGLVDFQNEMAKVPLKRGVGYQGWVGFNAPNVDRKELNYVQLRLCVKDALGNYYPVVVKGGTIAPKENEPILIPPLDM